MEAGYLSFGIQMAFVRLSNPSTASGRLLPIRTETFFMWTTQIRPH